MNITRHWLSIWTIITFVCTVVIIVNIWIERTTTIHVHQMSKDELLEEIERHAQLNDEHAEDAYIDRVWKKTPGRNGRKVNIKESYEKMKTTKRFDETLLVYDTIKPDIHLEDLPPAPIYRGHPKKKWSHL